ncbi:hypothetical protein GCQ56_02765 [Marinifilum sp. N1E240]|uniref:hypothetical protein n=1 Tax=Marinifilum sp. N1E240 TaxID=2608082 RepID=UPI00128DE525|nr:hypothetical protein [Marinifilum sp. N1E240]MPQ45921.1 hypothetical protein [Marinifilum sp. N1E240]
MDKSILSYCDSNEIETLASYILTELNSKNWSSDLIISNIIKELTTEKESLNFAIQQTCQDVLKENLRVENEIANDDFVCYKKFVKANTYLPDKEMAKDAMDLWELTSSHDLMLHKLSFERQISLSNTLLANLQSDKFKSKTDRLIGIAERINKFSESTAKLEDAYSKINKHNSKTRSVITPSIQKNTVRKIINENLIPHLENSSIVFPKVYEETFNNICEEIDNLNIKVRRRKTLKLDEDLQSILY